MAPAISPSLTSSRAGSPGSGLGLGLAIVDRLLAAMAASLELRDTPGGGLTAVTASLRVGRPDSR